MKRTISLLLVLLLCAALLAACSDKASEPSLVGTWTAEISYSDLAQTIDASYEGLSERFDLSGLQLQAVLEFKADGTFLFRADEASLDKLLQDMQAPLTAGIEQMLKDEYGMTDDQIQARLSQEGITMDDLADRYFEKLDRDALLEAVRGQYRWESGKLRLTAEGEDYYQAELTDTELRILSCPGEDPAGLKQLLPLTFKR